MVVHFLHSKNSPQPCPSQRGSWSIFIASITEGIVSYKFRYFIRPVSSTVGTFTCPPYVSHRFFRYSSCKCPNIMLSRIFAMGHGNSIRISLINPCIAFHKSVIKCIWIPSMISSDSSTYSRIHHSISGIGDTLTYITL